MISEEDTDKHLAKVLESLEERFEGGEKWALLYAIRCCLQLRRPLPEWLRVAFLGVYDSATGFEIKSWDDAFGRPHPKGTHLETEKRNLELRPLITQRVESLRAEKPIDKALFEQIGEELKLSGTIVSDIYYDQRTRELEEIIFSLDVPRKTEFFRDY